MEEDAEALAMREREEEEEERKRMSLSSSVGGGIFRRRIASKDFPRPERRAFSGREATKAPRKQPAVGLNGVGTSDGEDIAGGRWRRGSGGRWGRSSAAELDRASESVSESSDSDSDGLPPPPRPAGTIGLRLEGLEVRSVAILRDAPPASGCRHDPLLRASPCSKPCLRPLLSCTV